MHPMVPLLLVLGLLLGPAYYGYCVYLSGETAQRIELRERSDRWVLPDGSILRFHNSLAYRPVELDLSPDMNLVSLRLELEFPRETPADAPALQYQATLQQSGSATLERTLTVDPEPGRRKADFGTVEINFPGRYLFLLEESGHARATPAITLVLRHKIEQPNRYVVWIGLLLLLVAFVLQTHALWQARQRLPGG